MKNILYLGFFLILVGACASTDATKLSKSVSTAPKVPEWVQGGTSVKTDSLSYTVVSYAIGIDSLTAISLAEKEADKLLSLHLDRSLEQKRLRAVESGNKTLGDIELLKWLRQQDWADVPKSKKSYIMVSNGVTEAYAFRSVKKSDFISHMKNSFVQSRKYSGVVEFFLK